MGVFVYLNELTCLVLFCQSSPVRGPFFSIKNIKKNEDLVLAFPLCQKGGLHSRRYIRESEAFCFDLYIQPLLAVPLNRPLQDGTRLRTTFLLHSLQHVAVSSSPSVVFATFPFLFCIICFWDQWIGAVYGAEGCCFCWSICGGLLRVACWPKAARLRARWSS